MCTYARKQTHKHTHTHIRLTALFPGLPWWAGTRKVKPVWILLKQETVSGSGISRAVCKSALRSRQITTPAPHHSFFTDRMPFLPPNQQRQSTKGNNSHTLITILSSPTGGKVKSAVWWNFVCVPCVGCWRSWVVCCQGLVSVVLPVWLMDSDDSECSTAQFCLPALVHLLPHALLLWTQCSITSHVTLSSMNHSLLSYCMHACCLKPSRLLLWSYCYCCYPF